ncbi:ensconsin-like isoform X3 [Littorina saxatilis]|uniref:ensconsin-like isoform X3 n=1 Tax=Littorina saxatilis TaxID=31220 RepID=UPI0038B49050
MSSHGGTVYRAPSYFVWNHRKHASSSPRSSPRTMGDGVMNISHEGGAGLDAGPSPHKMRSPRSRATAVAGADNQSTDTKSSGVSGDSGDPSSAVSISPKHKDPDRIKKDREREERVRQARERLEEERKKKLVELQEQQRQAQENREKQLEMRRKKIEDLRRRDVERRQEVDRRRRERDEHEKSRRESLLLKAEERVARYEAWKRSGQKGGRSHVLGFGSSAPRYICQTERPRRSSSHSALGRRSPNGSDSDYSFRPQRRAVSACSTVRRHCCVDLNRAGPPPGCVMPPSKHLSVSTSVLYHKRNTDFSSSGALNVSNKPESLLALNTIPEGRRSFLAPYAPPPSRPKSVMTLSASSAGSGTTTGGVKLRENKSPRKQRPASVGTSMPSFVNLDTSTSSSSSPRSKSTDRLARERTRPRGSSSARRAEEKEKEKENEKKQQLDKSGSRISRSTLDRLSTPKQPPAKSSGDGKEAGSTPRRESPIARHAQARLVIRLRRKVLPRKAYSTSNLSMPRKKSSIRERTPREPSVGKAREHKTTPSAPSAAAGSGGGTASPSTPRGVSPASRTPNRTPNRVLSPPLPPGADEDGGSGAAPQARPSPAPSTPAEKPESEKPVAEKPVAEKPAAEKPLAESTPRATPTTTEKPLAESTPRATPTTSEKSGGDITAEEYKAKLAEKRRQARERAEKEAEEERKRQEELERQEEERQRLEEEEQLRQDEEMMKMAEEGRKAEEERLKKAIEAEDARKADEAARLEQEKLAKEEADRKAKEDAERQELERIEKARKDEEERLERKKRLEMIMKRVKTDNAGEGGKDSPKSVTSSPTKSVASTASSDASPMEPDNKTLQAMAAHSATPQGGEDSPREDSQSPANGSLSPVTAPSPVTTPPQETEEAETAKADEKTEDEDRTDAKPSTEMSPAVSGASTPRAETPENGADKPRFKSPLLQKLVEGKDDAGGSSSGGPRFKSPLLQNLLGKTKVGARMGLAQDHSISTPNLSQMDGSGNGQGDSSREGTPLGDTMSSSMIDVGTGDSSRKESLNRKEEKDVDTSEGSSSSSSHSSPSKTLVANGESIPVSAPTNGSRPEPMDISGTMESSAGPGGMSSSEASFWSGHDSGASFGSEDLRTAAPAASLQVSLNGHGPVATVQGQGLEDSSISMRSVESVTSSITDSATGSIFSSVSSLPVGHGHSSGDRDFEELIDLSLSNKTGPGITTTTSGVTLLDNADDLVNFNKVEEGSDESSAVPPPIIAFEENKTIRHPDTDLLS